MKRVVLLVGALVLGLLGSAPAHADPATVDAPEVYRWFQIGSSPAMLKDSNRFDWANMAWTDDDRYPLYDVQVMRTPMRAARPGDWQDWRAGIAFERHDFRVPQGQVLCVRARVQTEFGTSAWSDRDCVVRPVNDGRVKVSGPKLRVADRAVPDGRATSLRHGGRFALKGVPKGALYGAVARYNDDLSWPSLRLKGDRQTSELTADESGQHEFVYRVAKRRGTALVENTCCGRTFPIGGLLIVPRWAL